MALLMELKLHELEFLTIYIYIYIYMYIFKFDCPILDFLQIEFYIETLFWENQVTKEGHFPN